MAPRATGVRGTCGIANDADASGTTLRIMVGLLGLVDGGVGAETAGVEVSGTEAGGVRTKVPGGLDAGVGSNAAETGAVNGAEDGRDGVLA
jgi:hypothetical protein